MDYAAHLSKDRRLKKLLAGQVALRLKKSKNIHLYLCGSIISQQLSVKVADVIYKRFLALYGAKEPTPMQILETPFEKLRSIGLSNAKANYILNVSRFEIEQGMQAAKLKQMNNGEVITYLTQIKGVGKWTVEMLLMFALQREDIFAADDLGLQNAMKKLYKLDNTDRKKFREEIIRISEKWSPYRTYACIHLWQWKDNSI